MTKKTLKVVVKPRNGATKKKNKATKAVKEATAVGQLIRQLGTLGGGALGSYVGHPVGGAAAGNSLGAAISKWLGFGDYAVSTNSIVAKASTGIPMMHKTGQSVTIRHREFIATVESATSFEVKRSFKLNPGDHETFPWLSTIASSFQEYKFKGVVFHYIPTSGSAISGTSPSLGSVMMQTSYRANDTPPANKTELLNEYWSGESVPSESFAHPIECDPDENPFNVQYVRRGELPTGDNQLFYDLGQTHLCVQGQLASNNVLGDLWVTYEVELKKPIISSSVTSTAVAYGGYSTLATIGQPFAGLVKTFGNLSITNLLNGLRIGPAPADQYLMVVTILGTSIGGGWGTITATNAVIRDFNTNRSPWTTTSSGTMTYILAFEAIDATKQMTLVWPALAITGAFANVAVNITTLY